MQQTGPFFSVLILPYGSNIYQINKIEHIEERTLWSTVAPSPARASVPLNTHYNV